MKKINSFWKRKIITILIITPMKKKKNTVTLTLDPKNIDMTLLI